MVSPCSRARSRRWPARTTDRSARPLWRAGRPGDSRSCDRRPTGSARRPAACGLRITRQVGRWAGRQVGGWGDSDTCERAAARPRTILDRPEGSAGWAATHRTAACTRRGVSPDLKRFVYVLHSLANPDRQFVESAANVPMRIAAHNAGHSPLTATHRPWKLVAVVQFGRRSHGAALREVSQDERRPCLRQASLRVSQRSGHAQPHARLSAPAPPYRPPASAPPASVRDSHAVAKRHAAVGGHRHCELRGPGVGLGVRDAMELIIRHVPPIGSFTSTVTGAVLWLRSATSNSIS